MKLLKQVRQQLINYLWDFFQKNHQQTQTLTQDLQQRGELLVLDHFAIIDLPSNHSGLNLLSQIFSAIGFIPQGHGYLPEKQNEFLWLTEYDAFDQPASEVLPQIVVADFNLAELPPHVCTIIEHYTQHIQPSPLREIQYLSGKAYLGDSVAAAQLLQRLKNYFSSRQWPLPTVDDFHQVQAVNELLAWVLVFGHIPNHFTIATHLLKGFANFAAFNDYVENELKFTFNQQGSKIKGGSELGIEQSSTVAKPTKIQLADGVIEIANSFIEFVWRYPLIQPAHKWNDYFTGFIAQQANRVIESLYTMNQETA
jgi:hypothetical protein